jgi:hypothetical protein
MSMFQEYFALPVDLIAIAPGIYSSKYWISGSHSHTLMSRMHQSDSTRKGN